MERVAMSFSRGSSQPRNQTQVSCVSCTAWQLLHCWATWEAAYSAQLFNPNVGVAVANLNNQLTPSEGNYHWSCGEASSDHLKGLKSKTSFPKEETLLPQDCSSAPAWKLPTCWVPWGLQNYQPHNHRNQFLKIKELENRTQRNQLPSSSAAGTQAHDLHVYSDSSICLRYDFRNRNSAKDTLPRTSCGVVAEASSFRGQHRGQGHFLGRSQPHSSRAE